MIMVKSIIVIAIVVDKSIITSLDDEDSDDYFRVVIMAICKLHGTFAFTLIIEYEVNA